MPSKELWLVEKNRATVKTWLERRSSLNENLQPKRIELRNLQILKKMLEKSSQLWSSE